MYRFFKGSDVLDTEISPAWIALQRNGQFCFCSKDRADGVVIGGVAYNLIGTGKEIDAESVTMQIVSEYEVNKEQEQQKTALESAIAELSVLIAETKGGGENV